MYGLTEQDLKSIVEIFQRYPRIHQVILFGSRALGREKKGSDVDLAIKGQNSEDDILEVSGKLNDETPMPYLFDIIDYASIDNNDLKSHIDRVGQVIYTKK